MKIILRIKAAWSAFKQPDILHHGITQDHLARLAMCHGISILSAENYKGKLFPFVTVIGPREMAEIKHFLDGR